ncbi:hypothetical protein BH09BAC2_BH09BAC2_04860 [soil metagenome]
MLEIFALIYLTQKIGTIAFDKGLKVGRWKFYTVLVWLFGELTGWIFGVMIFSVDNIFSIALVGYVGAITGFIILKKYLEELPDREIDDTLYP